MSYNWLSKQNRKKLRSLSAHSAGRLRKQRRASRAWRAPLASATPVRAAKLGLIAFCYELFKNNKY